MSRLRITVLKEKDEEKSIAQTMTMKVGLSESRETTLKFNFPGIFVQHI